eukprot:Gregarina_sp_Poly_1__6222@NODE_32_length_19284_cov_132_623615_g29_i0_p7_GENE_NODE_32_length_19284_cov_132_623615_g29_i0NODE_32_length_19284_cov_132_623615_g29_i0_p7_ORF_typecomplete_len284_score30_39IF4E/PF01652_18/1_6e43_NODE_32_length_19284_cov_132_623615_g29_i031514002
MSHQPKTTDRAYHAQSGKERFGTEGYVPFSRRQPPGSIQATAGRPSAAPKSSRWEAFGEEPISLNHPPSTYPTSRYSTSPHPGACEDSSSGKEKAYDRSEPSIPYEDVPKHLLTHLHGSWCLWYTNVAQKTAENFSDCLIPICVVSTAEAFWALYSHCIRPSQLARGTEYHLFREGIKPMWEDPANQQGGTLTLRLRKDKDYLDYFWEALILAMIGEQLGQDICGAVAGKKYADDHLSIWDRYYDPKNHKTMAMNVLRILKLPEDGQTDYKSHSGSLKVSAQQ